MGRGTHAVLPPDEMSFEAWGALPEDEQGELVDGRLVEEEMPTQIHEIVVAFLVSLLRAWLVPRGGFVGGSEAKFAVTSRRGRKPDLYAYLPGRKLPPAHATVLRVPPDILVEVVSATPRDARRDRIEKLEEYGAFGVRTYWIVDPALRSLEILELGADGRYVHAVTMTEGIIERVPGCEGLRVDVDAIWAEIDRLLAATAPDEPG